jgi:HEAT repeat protein
MRKTALIVSLLLFSAVFPAAEVVDNNLGRALTEIFPELSEGYIDLNNNGELDRLDDMDELVPDSRVKDGIIQVQEILDFIGENYPFFFIDDLVAVRDAMDSTEGTIPELIALSYNRTIREIIRKKEELGTEGLYLSPSARKEAGERMSGYIADMVSAYKNETAEDERRFIEARDKLFTMIEQGYPVVRDLPDEDMNVLVSSLIQTTINERENNENRVKSAVKTLGKLGDPFAVRYILDLMPEEEYKLECIRALGEIGNTEAEKTLIDVLAAESSVNVREVALKALGRIGGEESLDLLISLLVDAKGSSPREEEAILYALSGLAAAGNSDRRISGVLTDYIGSPDPEMRILAAKGLAALSNQNNINLLLTALRDEKDEDVTIELIKSASSTGAVQVVGVLINMLRDETMAPKRTEVIIEELGKISEGIRAVATIQNYLGSENAMLREAARNAMLSLYGFNAKAVSGALSRAALTADGELYLAETASILAKLADPDTVSGLMNLLKSPYGEVKKHATWALYRIGEVNNTRMIADLVGIATSEAEPLDVRINAVRTLGLVDDPGADVLQTLSTTVKMRGAKYSMLRYFAIQALGRVRRKDAEIVGTLAQISLREGNFLIKNEALRTIRKIGMNIEGLTGTLNSLVRRSGDNEVTALVIEAFGDMKIPETADLAAALLEGAVSPPVKQRLVYALASCGTEKAMNELINLAVDEDVAEFAVALLEDMPSRLMKPLVDKRLRTESDGEIIAVLEDLKANYASQY